jgi:hypothetical protein
MKDTQYQITVKKKILLRIVVTLFSLWIVLLIVLYFSSGKYRDHAIRMLKAQVDKYLLTEIRINKEDIHVSLFKNFPYVSLDLNNILLKSAPGVNLHDFSITGADTLLFAERISLNFNIRSLLAKKYELKKIEVDGAILNLLSDKNGIENYNIIKSSEEDTASQDSIRFDLRKVTFKGTKLNYQNVKSDVLFSDIVSRAEMTGSFKQENFLIILQMEADDNCLLIKRSPYIDHESMTFNIAVEKRGKAYFFRDSEVTIFGVKLKVDGKYNTQSDDYNLSFSCNSVSLQRTKASLMKLWSDVLVLSPQNGDLNIRGTISGRGSANPSLSLQFEIKNGVFRNTKKNVRITDLYLKGSYSNGTKRNQQSSFLKIDSLSVQSGNSILFLTGNVQNFKSPIFEGRMRGYIELQKLMVIGPLASRFDLAGIAKGNIQVKGSLPSINTISNQDLQRIKLHGVVQLEDAYIKTLTNALPASTISGTVRVVNLMEIDLDDIIIRIGESDLQIKGDVTNLPYFISDKSSYPIYKCTVTSNEFHAEDFMPGSSDTKNGPFKIEFPDSLRIHADITLKSFAFGKFTAKDVSGIFSYNPKTMFVRNFSMKTMGGSISSDMRIDQSQDLIISENDAILQHVDMSELLYAFNEFGQTVITHEYIDGFLSGTIHVRATWDLFLNPVYKYLSLTSQATIDNGELIDYKPMLGLSDFIEVEELKHIQFDRLQTSVVVNNEKVIIGQMKINSSAISITGSGEHNFDNSYIYRFQVGLSDILYKKAKKRKSQNSEFGIIADDGLGRHIIPLEITGKDTVFEVKYDRKTAGTLFQEKVTQEKQTWKELTGPSEAAFRDSTPATNLEWDDEPTDPKKQDANNTESKQEHFDVEWKDE